MENACIYHRADLDGQCAAAIVNLYYWERHERVSFHGLNHEDFNALEFLDKFPDTRTLAIVDYSLSPSDVEILVKAGIEITWCDHHISAIKKYEGHPVVPKITVCLSRNNSACGAKLAWQHYFQTLQPEKRPVPLFVDLLSTYDTWNQSGKNKWEKSVWLNRAMSTHYDVKIVDTGWWYEHLMSERAEANINKLLQDGKIITRYLDCYNYRQAFAYGGTLVWHGFNFLALNCSGNSLSAVAAFDSGKHDAILLFIWSPRSGSYKISMYHSGQLKAGLPDLAAIAQEYGGGGHKGSASFRATKLPFAVEDIQPLKV